MRSKPFSTPRRTAASRDRPSRLGGGAAVCDHLVEEWTAHAAVSVSPDHPAILGSAPTPSGTDLVRFGERAYARFSRAFERAATEEILRHDPAATVVLANDVSEGPDFAALAGAAIASSRSITWTWSAYVAAIYGRGWIRPGNHGALVSVACALSSSAIWRSWFGRSKTRVCAIPAGSSFLPRECGRSCCAVIPSARRRRFTCFLGAHGRRR